MAFYILKKFIQAVLLLALVSVLVFVLLDLAPGSVESTLLHGKPATPATIAQIRAQYHLNDSLTSQYFQWISHAVRFDFGDSVVEQQPVSSVLSSRLSISGLLALLAILMVLIFAIPSGITAGMRQGTAVDSALTGMSTVSLATPVYAVATILLYTFGIKFGLFPAFGAGDGFPDRLLHLFLPAATLAVAQFSMVFRQMRASVLGVEGADYLVFARARGLSRRRIQVSYIFRNSMLPVLTVSGLLLAGSLGGVVFVETVFSIPGLGSLLVESISSKDIPVVQALALLSAALVFFANFVVDVLYGVIDPRIREGGRQ